MFELMKAAVSIINLPFTALLFLVICYWCGVILGFLDIELFDIDSDFDTDVDLSGGFLNALMGFLFIGELPVMIILSILIISGWCFSMIANYYFNPHYSVLTGLLLLIPNLILSLFITKIAGSPLRKLYAMFDTEDKRKMLYEIGVVTTSKVTADFGQIEVPSKGAPIILNARTSKKDIVLHKGDKVLVYDEDKEKGIFYVEKFNG